MTRSLCCRSFLGSLPLTIFNFEEEERFYFWQSASYFFTIFHYLGFSLICSLSYFFVFLSCFFRVGFRFPSFCSASHRTLPHFVLLYPTPLYSASHFTSHSTPHPSGNRCLRFSYIVFSI